MFCPACGIQNSDDLAYCRGCGENLKAISQVMKGHAPLTIASKIDELIEKKHERFRRDGILVGIFAIITTIWTLVSGSLLLSSINPWIQAISAFIVPGGLWLFSGWNLLLFRRSLELKGLTNQPAQLPAKREEEEANESDGIIFCPSCGHKNRGFPSFCKQCGFSLRFEPSGLAKYLPKSLILRLDHRIAKNEDFKSPYQSGWRIIIGASGFIFIGAMQGISGAYGRMALYLMLGIMTIVASGWDFLLTKRTSKDELGVPLAPSAWQDFLTYTGSPKNRSKAIVGLIAFIGLFVVPFAVPLVASDNTSQMILGSIFLLTMIIGAVGMNFRQFQRESREKRLAGNFNPASDDFSALTTSDLDGDMPETKQLAARADFSASETRPFSVTEETTRALEPADMPIRVETTRLDNK